MSRTPLLARQRDNTALQALNAGFDRQAIYVHSTTASKLFSIVSLASVQKATTVLSYDKITLVVRWLALQLGCLLCSQMLQLLRPCKCVGPEEQDRHYIKERFWAALVNVLGLVVVHPLVVSSRYLAGRQLL